MAAPPLKGLHHIKLPVSDLDTSRCDQQRTQSADAQIDSTHAPQRLKGLSEDIEVYRLTVR